MVLVAVASNGSIVGDGSKVSVGAGVELGISVGVLVGKACSVWATMVKAEASAVCCTSTGFTVGAACGAQAPTSNINNTATINAFRFMYGRDPLLKFYSATGISFSRELRITHTGSVDNLVFIKGYAETVILMEGEISNHLVAAHPCDI